VSGDVVQMGASPPRPRMPSEPDEASKLLDPVGEVILIA
jgi:hypothetical protein